MDWIKKFLKSFWKDEDKKAKIRYTFANREHIKLLNAYLTHELKIVNTNEWEIIDTTIFTIDFEHCDVEFTVRKLEDIPPPPPKTPKPPKTIKTIKNDNTPGRSQG